MHAPIPVLFYTKRGCHLCEDVDEVLEILAEQHPLAVQRIEITEDAEVYGRYWQRIPVVTVGDVTLEALIDAQTLQRVVLQAVRDIARHA